MSAMLRRNRFMLLTAWFGVLRSDGGVGVRSWSSNPKSLDSYSDSDSWDLEYWDVRDVRDAIYSFDLC